MLRALNRPGGSTLAETAEATGLSYAAARRHLLALTDLGYVRNQGRRHLPTPRVLELGHAPLSTLTLPDIAQPHLVQLTAELGQSSSLTVLDGSDVRYVARSATSRITSAAIATGTHLPAYATAMGRGLLAALPHDEARTRIDAAGPRPTSPAALLAQLDATRETGHALVDQELEDGLRSIAVPVHDHAHHTVAAVNVALHSGPETPEQSLAAILPALRHCAAALSADLAAAFPHGPVPR